MNISRSLYYCVLLLLLIPLGLAEAQEWTRFRGPNGTGVNRAASLPVTWSEKNFLWKSAVPGIGHSSPVLWGNRLFLTSGDRQKGTRIVLCFDAKNGEKLWQREFDSTKYRMHRRNSPATSTPTVDEERVYVCWATPKQLTIMALDHEGKDVWQKDLGSYRGNHGFGVSPILHKDLLILANDQDKTGSLLALDRKTGKIRWEIPRKSGNATYSTPLVYKSEQGSDQIIFTNWQHGMTSVDPDSGKVLWELSIFEPKKKERAIASPVRVGNLVLGTCGFVTAQKHFVAVRPGDSAAGTEPKEIWRVEKTVSYLPTPLVLGNLVFLCTEKGVANCLDGKTGKVIWNERLDGEFYSSPVSDGKNIFCTSTNGEVFVLAGSDTFRGLARNSLGEGTQGTPAIANGCLYFRTNNHLICVGN